MKTRTGRVLLAIATAAAFAAPAAATTVTLTIDTVPSTGCTTSWLEQGCRFTIGPTTADDYSGPGYCVALPWTGGILLMGSRLYLDLGGVSGIENVEIDINEGGGAYSCTRAFLYSDPDGLNQIGYAASAAATGPQTLSVGPGGQTPVLLAISGHECAVEEIRLTGGALAVEPESWGRVKAVYRP